MNNLSPFSRKEIFHFGHPSFWDDPSFRAGIAPCPSVNLLALPALARGKVHSLRGGQSLVKIGTKDFVEFMTPQAGYLPCELGDNLAPLPHVKKWQGCRCLPEQILALPAPHNVLFSFSPSLVEYAMLLCFDQKEHYLLIAPKPV